MTQSPRPSGAFTRKYEEIPDHLKLDLTPRTVTPSNVYPEQSAEFRENDQVPQGHVKATSRPRNFHRVKLGPRDTDRNTGTDDREINNDSPINDSGDSQGAGWTKGDPPHKKSFVLDGTMENHPDYEVKRNDG